ncbi:putative secreted esterase [Legionella birminghamensis]|uniref:Secreted esterase n=1 Tax=Legionella birminghamensis TaxID=28083 RepID=A0A378IA52_9GAMM|nr:serine hydrolase [Legionella birminghamensis]KTC75981.1 putative secreted esterase [Legionella birminghamensis]STX32107.1 putative secreted esterase [Legionella birminghamensis]
MPDSIRLNVAGGVVDIVIDNSLSALTATFVYTPNPEATPNEMLLGYHDAAGQDHMVSMTLEPNGQWTARRTIAPNESSDFFMHPDVKPGKLSQKPDIINKIALSDGKIVTSVYENPKLTSKGRLQTHVLSAEGQLSEPVEAHYQSKPGEQLLEIYFPAGYNPSETKDYNIQVMLDGDMHLRQDAFGNSMNTTTILDNLIAEGKMAPAIAVFVSPTPPVNEQGQWVDMQRLKEYGCNPQTDAMLAAIPRALRQAGIKAVDDPQRTGLCGQSMGGLQALYTAKMHPDIYGQVIAQSPSVWWGPPTEKWDGPVLYEADETWRAPLANKEEQQYLLGMLKSRHDRLSGRQLPTGNVNVYLQAGTHETGAHGGEPLTQAAMSLARELNTGCRLHNGGHAAEAWATGLALSLPLAHPGPSLMKDTALEIQEVDGINGFTQHSAEELMDAGKIPGVSLASYRNGQISSMSMGSVRTGEESVTQETRFGAASLSKPVFAYLVLKLIATNQADEAVPGFGKFNSSSREFNLKTPLHEVFRDENGKPFADADNPFLKKFKPEQWEWAKRLTAEIILSHRTGLHIFDKEPYLFQFEPGTYYAYSGPGIDCLQKTIETLTETDLETLAWANIFAPHALNLPGSSYGAAPVAANSLHTTASDYARFISAWVNDDQLNYAFEPAKPVYSMDKDYFPQSEDKLVEAINIPPKDKEQVTWGLGIGLVTNDQGDVIGAYHTGDMNEWRAGFAAEIDPETKSCTSAIVYCANSANGHILAEQVLPKTLRPALNYFFPTYGFARTVNELGGDNLHGMNPNLLKKVTHHYKERLQESKTEASAESQSQSQYTPSG